MKWESKYVDISTLKSLENNPRTIEKSELIKLDRDHTNGVFKPIVINNDGTILAGNQRYEYYKNKGHKEVWVSKPEKQLTQKQAKEIILLDNTHRGEFDTDLLVIDFEDTIKDLELDLDLKLQVTEDDKLPEVEDNEIYRVYVDCLDEIEQRKIYNLLTDNNIDAKLTTI